MKHVLTLLLASLSYLGTAQINVAFVGKRFFNFVGGTGEQECIIIAKDGTTTIQSATGNEGPNGPVISYKGKYKLIIKDNNGYYYKIEKDRIVQVDRDGHILKGCNGNENDPCVVELYAP